MLAVGGLGGRVDQAFSLVNQMYKTLPRQMFLLSEMNISFLLHVGSNRIHAPSSVYGPCCGLIPIAGPTTYTLKGFRWNLGSFHQILTNNRKLFDRVRWNGKHK
jgi:thiamine pyrophosphokinase